MTQPVLTDTDRRHLEALENRSIAWAVGLGVLSVLGLIISFASYAAAADNPEGGTYVVLWGAVVFGAIGSVRNALRATKCRRILNGRASLASVVATPSRPPAVQPERPAAPTYLPRGRIVDAETGEDLGEGTTLHERYASAASDGIFRVAKNGDCLADGDSPWLASAFHAVA